MKTVYKIWCEYDIGQDHVVFTSKKNAIAFGKEALKEYELNYNDVFNDELISYEKIKVM